MAASKDRKPTPNFFDEDDPTDPIVAATSKPRAKPKDIKKEAPPDTNIEAQKHRNKVPVVKKKKVGYYFKPENVERLETILLKIQLQKIWKGRISDFVEAIVEYGLDDLESENSNIINRLKEKASTTSNAT